MARNRSGEKWGWIGGWFGGFIWVFILSIMMLIQGKSLQGGLGLALTLSAVIVIIACAPWRYPDRPYWQLMLPVYAAFFLAIAWALWSYDGIDTLGLGWQSSFLLLPLLLPMAISGKKCWNDGSN